MSIFINNSGGGASGGHIITIDGVEYDNDINLTFSRHDWKEVGILLPYEYLKTQTGTGSYFYADTYFFDNKWYFFRASSPYESFYFDLQTRQWNMFDISTPPTGHLGRVAFDSNRVELYCFTFSNAVGNYYDTLNMYKYNFGTSVWDNVLSYNIYSANVTISNTRVRCFNGSPFSFLFLGNYMYICIPVRTSTSSSATTGTKCLRYDITNNSISALTSYPAQYRRTFVYNGDLYTYVYQSSSIPIYKINSDFSFTLISTLSGVSLHASSYTYGNHALIYDGSVYLGCCVVDSKVCVIKLSDDLTSYTVVDDTLSSYSSHSSQYFHTLAEIDGRITWICNEFLREMFSVYEVTL